MLFDAPLQLKIGSAAIQKHYKELLSKKPRSKHPMYNSLLKLFRKKEIKYRSINGHIIVDSGAMNGLWIKPNGVRCWVSLSTWHAKHIKGVSNFDYVVDYSPNTLFDKLLKHLIISPGYHEFLTTANKD
jgi:hypothetical protein